MKVSTLWILSSTGCISSGSSFLVRRAGEVTPTVMRVSHLAVTLY